jgi:hypothetical protein
MNVQLYLLVLPKIKKNTLYSKKNCLLKIFRAHRGLQQPERSRIQHDFGGDRPVDGGAPGASAARVPADGAGLGILQLLQRLLLPGRHKSTTGGGHLPGLQLAAAAAGHLLGRLLRDGHSAALRVRLVHFSREKESGGRLGRAPRKRREARLHLLRKTYIFIFASKRTL